MTRGASNGFIHRIINLCWARWANDEWFLTEITRPVTTDSKVVKLEAVCIESNSVSRSSGIISVVGPVQRNLSSSLARNLTHWNVYDWPTSTAWQRVPYSTSVHFCLSSTIIFEILHLRLLGCKCFYYHFGSWHCIWCHHLYFFQISEDVLSTSAQRVEKDWSASSESRGVVSHNVLLPRAVDFGRSIGNFNLDVI